MTAAPAGRHLEHENIDYTGLDGFVSATVPFVVGGLDADEPTMVAVGRARVSALKEALGYRASRVEFVELEALGSSPSRIISTWRHFAERHPGRSMRGVTEPSWPGREDDASASIDGSLHESLLGLALSHVDLRLLHARDTTRHAQAHRRADPEPMAAIPERATELSFTAAQLGDIRNYAVERALRSGLDEGRASDLALAVHELATNSVYHGGGSGSLVIWDDAESVYCEVRDDGAQPGADRRDRAGEPPLPRGGRGLWLVHQLCDRVDVRPLGTGHAVRVRMHLERAEP